MQGQAQGLLWGFFMFDPIMFGVMAVVIVVPFRMIFQQAGHWTWCDLLMAKPRVSVGPPFALALSA